MSEGRISSMFLGADHWLSKAADEGEPTKRPSPMTHGNVLCTNCRCGGFNCPGMPANYEDRLVNEGDEDISMRPNNN